MNSYSFYYRDTLDLKVLYPNATKFSLLFTDDNLVIENGVVRLLNPDEFNPSQIHNIVRVYPHKYDYFKILVSIRCWRNDEFRLKEVTRFGILKSNRLYQFLYRAINKVCLLPINVHLLTVDGVSYFSYNNCLLKVIDGKKIVVGKIPPMADPIYFEFLLFRQEAFFRTGDKIYMSAQCMTRWSLIYEGKRAIKNSMVWIEAENALLFSEYTPGLNLCRHHLNKYYVDSGETKKVFTFYSPSECRDEKKIPYCRHIHVLMKDPYTGDIYMGVGDSDEESAIYRSTNNGNTFELLGNGNQTWRTLSFIFTENYIMWDTDSPDPQYLSCIKRTKMCNLPVNPGYVTRWPLFNSASWNSVYDEEFCLYIMSASCEGALYDNKNRVYGIKLDNDVPTIYNLFEDESSGKEQVSRGHQLFVLGKDNEGVYWFYDTRRHYYRKFILCK